MQDQRGVAYIYRVQFGIGGGIDLIRDNDAYGLCVSITPEDAGQRYNYGKGGLVWSLALVGRFEPGGLAWPMFPQ